MSLRLGLARGVGGIAERFEDRLALALVVHHVAQEGNEGEHDSDAYDDE